MRDRIRHFQAKWTVAMTTLNVNDGRVQRTRGLLHDALITPILERGYDAATIKDVVQRAGVGRSTIYKHLSDLEGLLVISSR